MNTLQTMLRQITDAYSHMSHITLAHTSAEHPQRFFPRSFPLSSFPDTMGHYIQTHIKHAHVYNATVQHIPVQITFLLEKTESQKTLIQYARQLVAWLHIAFPMRQNKTSIFSVSNPFSFWIFLTSLTKKSLHTTHTTKTNRAKPRVLPWKAQEVNTGFTRSCFHEIVVYRKEEWFKVCIHETFHALGLDFSNKTEEQLRPVHRKLAKYFHVQSNIRLYETYCETWARIWHTLFVLRSHVPWSVRISNAVVAQFMAEECRFSILQMQKVLSEHHLTFAQLIHPTDAELQILQQYREETSVVAYFILTAITMGNVYEFIEWCRVENGPWLCPFKSTPHKFADWIIQHSTKLTNNVSPQNMAQKKSLRMTILEICPCFN